MPQFGPVSRRNLIRYLRSLGFDGPNPGGKHPSMARGSHVITIPNTHGEDIGRDLLKRILDQAGITREEWERL